jgi:hypothetical protein
MIANWKKLILATLILGFVFATLSFCQNQKLSEMTKVYTYDANDLLYLTVDPNNSPLSRGAPLEEFFLNTGGLDRSFIDFDLANGATLAEGRLFWDANDKTLELGMSGGNVALQIGQETQIRAKNVSGGTMANGTVVYVSGGIGQNAEIDLADPNTFIEALPIGITTESIGVNNFGYVTAFGLVRDVNTAGMSEGDILWLTDSGTYSNVQPTTALLSVVVGQVISAHATEGVIFAVIDIIPRVSDLSDVTISSIDNDDILQWNPTTSRFNNTNDPNFSSATIGNSSDYVDVNATGETVFVGNASLPWGELWVNGNSTPITIGSGSTWYQVTSFATANGNNTTPSAASDDITITKAGIYLVHVSLSFSGATAANIYEFQIQKNNGATALTNLHCERKVSAGGDVGSCSISGIADLSVSDTLELWVQNLSGGNDATVKDANFSIVQIGG